MTVLNPDGSFIILYSKKYQLNDDQFGILPLTHVPNLYAIEKQINYTIV